MKSELPRSVDIRVYIDGSGTVGEPSNRMDPEAGDGARTHDPQLGKLMLYQLSYARNWLG